MNRLRIRELREEAGYTQEYVAQCVGVTRCTVTQWELGNKFPNTAKLPKLAALFHCSIDDLFTGLEAG